MSLLAVVMQYGIAVFVVIAVVFLHERASSADAAGLVGIMLAMVLLALSVRSAPSQGRLNSLVLGVLMVLALLGATILYSGSWLRRNGAATAIAARVAFGLSTLYTKALSEILMAPFGLCGCDGAEPLLYLMVSTNIGELVLLQNSFHWARGIIAMPRFSAISNLLPIIGGVLAFDESLPLHRASAGLRIAAFALTIMASVLVAGAEITDIDAHSAQVASPVEKSV